MTLPTINPEDHFIVPAGERDNYCDSKLFYANKNYGIITDIQRCLTNHDEMPFYKGYYNQFILDAENVHGFDMTEFCITDNELFENSVHSKIWHELTIFLGNVWLINVFQTQDITSFQIPQ